MDKLSNIQSGIAGVYLAAAELTMRGFITSITSRNSKGIDILISNEEITRTIGIQVKTNQRSEKKWMLNEKADNCFTNNLFYIFVNLNDGNRPDFYVVPSEFVSNYIKESHKKWMATMGRNNQPHNDSSIRNFYIEEDNFKDAWNLLLQ